MPKITSNTRPAGDALLRLPDVLRRTGRSKAGVYVLIREGSFPAPVRVGKRAVAWRERDVAEWVRSRETCVYAPLPRRESTRSHQSTAPGAEG